MRLERQERDKYSEEERLAMLDKALKKVEEIGQRELDIIDRRIQIESKGNGNEPYKHCRP